MEGRGRVQFDLTLMLSKNPQVEREQKERRRTGGRKEEEKEEEEREGDQQATQAPLREERLPH